MKPIYIMIFIILGLISNINANEWSSQITAGPSSWSIDRQSQTLNFGLTGSVEGHITPIIGYHGRNLTPYSSFYANIKDNDVESRTRTSALDGSYQANENIALVSSVSDDNDDIEIYVNKPSGSDIYTFLYLESWPALLIVNRGIKYSGRQINDRDFVGNNRDFVENRLLYNRVLKKDQKARMWLENMSAAVLATNNNLISANIHFNKSLDYEMNVSTTGIADLRYSQSASQFNFKRQIYIPADESRETYYGTYNISRKMHMEMEHKDPLDDKDGYEWIPCCYGWLSNLNGTTIEKASNYSCILAKEGNDADSWFQKGATLIKLGNYSEAIAAYERVIKISYSNATAWNQRGVALALMGRYSESIDSFKNATNIDPKYAAPWYNKGTTLATIGRYEEAIQDYDKAIHINSQEPGFWYAKGSALQALNRKAESEIAFAKAQKIADG